MLLLDVNLLIYAHRQEGVFAAWLDLALASDETVGLAEIALSAVVRIATNVRLFPQPSSLDETLRFCDDLLEHRNTRTLRPGPAHWATFSRLCRAANVTGPRVSDAYLAAIAIEQDAEFITTDRDFGRFPGLRWRHPLE